ncbi:olfactory receptor 10AG1-like [Ambystoma mexicanum]|uniref:olfactory receptor 10AG1-like n=1 Tax=Ambystoma mexicanum TaxID=8296 RepID=UPI0037E7B8DF
MIQSNLTSWTGFLLLGFSDLSPQLQLRLFALFLAIYLMTLLGNLVIIVIITLDATLHTPMYFFLKNLSLLEIAFTTITVPKMLTIFLLEDKGIFFFSCAIQMCLFLALGGTDVLLLTVMALDRYVAICIPLRYMTIMNKSRCVALVLTTWIVGIVVSVGQTSFIFYLPFCKSRAIYHFVCDIPPLLRLSCSDTYANEMVTMAASVVLLLLPLLFILITYAFIITKIAKMKSTEGRHKAVSTCASHIASVTLLYGSAMLAYMQPKSNYSQGKDRVFAAFYAVIMPMLNPLIYSLKNKDVKQALRKQITSNLCPKKV